MEMAMRAGDDVCMSQDLTPPIPPLAAALHDSFLHSHCSSCFHHLPSRSSNRCLSCSVCTASVRYCSPACLASHSIPHTSSAECHFFCKTKNYQADHPIPNSTDLRVALRLLHLLERNGPLHLSYRIGGLLVGDLKQVLEEGGELAQQLMDDAVLMSSVRNDRVTTEGGVKLEMMVLLTVMRNSVEVQVGEAPSLGVALYGPQFSWFNHSCAPNAFYRIQLYDAASSQCIAFRVVPSAMGETENHVGERWDSKEDTLNQEHCIFGPRVVVRSIKPIMKGDEVCITYTDLLQPKGTRHIDLWPKFRFTCHCSRCTEFPQSYVDHIITCDSRSINSQKGTITCTNWESGYEHLTDAVQEAIEVYTSDNPELCCEKLEMILSQNSLSNPLLASEVSADRFYLHPYHHLSLMACMTLASAYRLRSQISDKELSFNLSRNSVAYSTLLCFSAYQLFLCEPSFMASTSHFLLIAGEAMLNLLGIQIMEHSITANSRLHVNGDIMSQTQFQSNTRQFVDCVLELLPQCWPFLVQNSLYLENIESPTNFRWASFRNNQHRVFRNKQKCVACELKSEKFDEEMKKYLCKLAVHCLIHGMYLASICYGHNCPLIYKAKSLLNC